ncbi:hypothetical protein [Hoeflea alexandrii]
MAPIFILSLKKVLEFFKSADKVAVNGDDRSVRRRLMALKAAPAFETRHACAGWRDLPCIICNRRLKGIKWLRPDRDKAGAA